jgi:hypothetical protein
MVTVPASDPDGTLRQRVSPADDPQTCVVAAVAAGAVKANATSEPAATTASVDVVGNAARGGHV